MDEARADARLRRRVDNLERDLDRLDKRVSNIEDDVEGLEIPEQGNWAKSAATLLFALSAFVTPVVVAIIAGKGT